MWFTIACFTIPYALYLFYRGLADYRKKRRLKLVGAFSLLFITTIIAIIEIKNIRQIKQELTGTYYSINDTLMLQKDESFRLKSSDSIIIGRWEFDPDNMNLSLNSDGRQMIEMSITYKDGLTLLETGPIHNNNTKNKRYTK
jgi:hypothetical protein